LFARYILVQRKSPLGSKAILAGAVAPLFGALFGRFFYLRVPLRDASIRERRRSGAASGSRRSAGDGSRFVTSIWGLAQRYADECKGILRERHLFSFLEFLSELAAKKERNYVKFRAGATPPKRSGGGPVFIGKRYFEFGSLAPMPLLPRRPRSLPCFPNERPTGVDNSLTR
jgi:hypothetical protein